MLTQADYNEAYYTAGGAVGGYDNYAATAPARAGTFALELALELGGLNGKTVLDVGCGFGFLVRELVDLGAKAYGIELSAHARSRVPWELASRIVAGDAGRWQDFITVKGLAGLRPHEKFDLIVDQDLIPCLTDEVAASYFYLAKKHGTVVVHRFENSPHMAQWYNYKPLADWRAISGGSPTEFWLEN